MTSAFRRVASLNDCRLALLLLASLDGFFVRASVTIVSATSRIAAATARREHRMKQIDDRYVHEQHGISNSTVGPSPEKTRTWSRSADRPHRLAALRRVAA